MNATTAEAPVRYRLTGMDRLFRRSSRCAAYDCVFMTRACATV